MDTDQDEQPTETNAYGATTRFLNNRSDKEGLFGVPPIGLKIGFYLFLLIWMGYIVSEASTYSRIENYFFPILIGVPVIMLIMIQFVIIKYPWIIDRVKPDQPGKDSDMFEAVEDLTESPRTKVQEYKYEIVMIGWVILLPVMSYYLGMGFTTLIYTFSLTLYLTRDLRTSVLVTAAVVMFVWILFIEILGMIIWDGVFDFPDPFRVLSDLRF